MENDDEEMAEEVPATPVVETGEGRFQFPDGSLYEGEYRKLDGEVKRHGRGRFTDGAEVYEGAWVEDVLDGCAKITYATGAVYEGDLKDSRYHGSGKYVWTDGAAYEGAWQNGKMHGEGVFQGPDGVEWRGTFRNGAFHNGKAWVILR